MAKMPLRPFIYRSNTPDLILISSAIFRRNRLVMSKFHRIGRRPCDEDLKAVEYPNMVAKGTSALIT